MQLPDWPNSGLLVAIVVLAVLGPFVWRVLKRVGALLFVRAAVRGALTDIGKRALEQQAEVIHLEPLAEPQWKDPGAMGVMAAGLRRKGFTDCGVFSVDKIPGARVWVFCQEQTSVSAHLYEHPKAGFWPELVTRYTNGSSHSITTMPATGIKLPAWISVIRSPQAPTDQLYERLLRERRPSGIEHLDRQNVVRAYEDAYSRQMIAQKNQGLSPEEVAAVMKRWAEKKAASI